MTWRHILVGAAIALTVVAVAYAFGFLLGSVT